MRKAIFILFMAGVFALGGCSQKAGTPADTSAQHTPAPTDTTEESDVTPTDVPATPTSTPTTVPKPTATPKPTLTPTPKPTDIPIPDTPLVTFDRERTYPDNTTQTQTGYYLYNNPAPQGTVIDFTYTTKNHMREDGKEYEKSALVYLPPCYDENDTETKYNVLYLMHGGGDTPKWYLDGAGSKSNITRMFDSMITKGEIEPMIVCAVSYYTEYSNDATQNCLNFHYELMNDVIPALETAFPTYAEDVTSDGLAASRTHRAFGGFSMGGVTTWSVFEHCLDEFAYFMPMSGDCWALGTTAGSSRALQTAQHLADKVKEHGKTAEDFFIYAGCGIADIANPNLTPQINQMLTLTDTFLYCKNFANGNLYHCIVPGGHDVNTVTKILYNGVPKLFH